MEKTSIILGLSGGPDSIFLLNFLASLHHEGFISLIAAHLDHQWRIDSEKDVAFCQLACQNLGISLITQRISDLKFSVRYNGSKEEMARKQRRFFLEQVRNVYKADYIALGHHADDQDETFFIRLLRGTSLAGLSSIRARSGTYLRPLLCLRKQEILTYLHKQNIAYCTDSTNASDDFLRNRLRKTVLPALKQTDARFTVTLSKTIEQLQAAEAFIANYTHNQYIQLVMHNDGHHFLNIKKYRTIDRVIQHRIVIQWLRDYGVIFPVHSGFFTEIMDFLSHPRGGTHRIHHDWMIVKKSHIAHISIQIG